MLGCCLGRNQIHDEEELESPTRPTSNEELKFNIQKQLVKTRRHNHIGYGISSNVFKINVNFSNFSCKIIKENWKKETQNEINVLRNIKLLNTDFFPKIQCSFNLNECKVICYDYIEGTDLQNLISEKNPFEYKENDIIYLTYQILRGLQELLRLDYVHLDLKPENIIISSLNPIKITIIDLSFTENYKDNNGKKNKVQGTIGYISPEILLYKTFYKNTDIWSLGIIIYLLYTSTFIFGIDEETYTNNIESSECVHNLVLNSQNKLSLELQNIVSKCLEYNAINRISVNSLINIFYSIKDLYIE